MHLVNDEQGGEGALDVDEERNEHGADDAEAQSSETLAADGQPAWVSDDPETVQEPIVLVLLQATGDAQGSISRSLVADVIEEIERLPDASLGGRLDVWLESPGGDAHAAYKLGLYLRAHFSQVNFVVPDYAKSAATLLCLAGDRIYMAPAAELGPLDTQESREGELRMRSALDTADAIQSLFEQAVLNSIRSGGTVLAHTGLARDKTISHLLRFAGEFMRPLLEQLDPVAINAANTSLLVALEYGARLLAYTKQGQVDEMYPLVQRLVRDYPTHGYVIDRKEARDAIGLPVENLEDYEMRDICRSLYDMSQARSLNVVKVFHASDLVNLAGEPQDEDEDGHAEDDEAGDEAEEYGSDSGPAERP